MNLFRHISLIVLAIGSAGCSEVINDPDLKSILNSAAVIVVSDVHENIVDVHVLDSIPESEVLTFYRVRNRRYTVFGTHVDSSIQGLCVAGTTSTVDYGIQDAKIVGVSANEFIFPRKKINRNYLRTIADFRSSPERRSNQSSYYFDCLSPKDLGPLVSANEAEQILKEIDSLLIFRSDSIESYGVSYPIISASRTLDHAPFIISIVIGTDSNPDGPMSHLIVTITSTEPTFSNAATHSTQLSEKYIGALLKNMFIDGERLFWEINETIEQTVDVFGTRLIRLESADCNIEYIIKRPCDPNTDLSEQISIIRSDFQEALNK